MTLELATPETAIPRDWGYGGITPGPRHLYRRYAWQ
jgi:hypothetical protein